LCFAVIQSVFDCFSAIFTFHSIQNSFHFFFRFFHLLLFPIFIPRVFLLAVFSRSKSVLNKQHHLSRRVALLIPTLPTPKIIGGEASSQQILLTFT